MACEKHLRPPPQSGRWQRNLSDVAVDADYLPVTDAPTSKLASADKPANRQKLEKRHRRARFLGKLTFGTTLAAAPVALIAVNFADLHHRLALWSFIGSAIFLVVALGATAFGTLAAQAALLASRGRLTGKSDRITLSDFVIVGLIPSLTVLSSIAVGFGINLWSHHRWHSVETLVITGILTIFASFMFAAEVSDYTTRHDGGPFDRSVEESDTTIRATLNRLKSEAAAETTPVSWMPAVAERACADAKHAGKDLQQQFTASFRALYQPSSSGFWVSVATLMASSALAVWCSLAAHGVLAHFIPFFFPATQVLIAILGAWNAYTFVYVDQRAIHARIEYLGELLTSRQHSDPPPESVAASHGSHALVAALAGGAATAITMTAIDMYRSRTLGGRPGTSRRAHPTK